MDNIKLNADFNQTNRGIFQSSRLADEETASGSPLGNATELRTPPKKTVDGFYIDSTTSEVLKLGNISESEHISNARSLRFSLQDTAAQILLNYYPNGAPVNSKGYEVHHRTCTCSRFIVSNTVQILKSQEFKKSFFGGTMNCGNSRTCPVCAQKINERKANEMRLAFNQAKSKGYYISMLTFTSPHSSADKIEYLISNISKALSAFWRGATATRFKKRYRYKGNIRSFEIRYGRNGWHPHFHIIVFSNEQLPCTFREKNSYSVDISKQSPEWIDILNRWKSVCLKSGLKCPNEYGLDIQNAGEAGAYITKFGSDGEILETKNSSKKITWDMPDEMTKGNTKKGIKGSLSPWDLIALSSDMSLSFDDRSHYRKLFLFYSRAMHRVTLIKWSRGLRDLFDLEEQKSDQEIVENYESSADVLCHLTPAEWKFIYKHSLRSLILTLIENGGKKALARFLYSNFYTGSDLPTFYRHFLNRKKDFISDELNKDFIFNVDGNYNFELIKKRFNP